MRNLPKQEPRVETGSVQFGDDWPGLFIRGDECIDLRDSLATAIGMIGMPDCVLATRMRYYITLCNEAIINGRRTEPEGR